MFRLFSQPSGRSLILQLDACAERVLGASAATIAARGFASDAKPQEAEAKDKPKWGETLISAVMKEKADSGAPTAGLFACSPNDTVYEAVHKMATANVGSIVIMSDSSKQANSVVGLITERDYMRKVVIEGKSSKEMLCSSLMTPAATLLTLTSNDSVLAAMKVMEDHNVRHIPIIDDGSLLGMLSIKDVVGTMVNEHTAEVESMAEYIGGSY